MDGRPQDSDRRWLKRFGPRKGFQSEGPEESREEEAREEAWNGCADAQHYPPQGHLVPRRDAPADNDLPTGLQIQ